MRQSGIGKICADPGVLTAFYFFPIFRFVCRAVSTIFALIHVVTGNGSAASRISSYSSGVSLMLT